MDHQVAQELFSDYLEGELAAAERSALEDHLAQCASCRQELDGLRQMVRSLSGLRVLPPPQDFTTKVQQRIHRRSRGRFFRAEHLLTRLPFEWISFVIIILMMVVYILLMQGQVKGVRPTAGDGRGTAGALTVPVDGPAAAGENPRSGDGKPRDGRPAVGETRP